MANIDQIQTPDGTNYDIDAKTVSGFTVGTNVPSNAVFTDNNITYTFANGTNGFTVTPSGGTAQTVNVIPYPYEENLRWGGKNMVGDYGCIDAAMVSELNANRFSFLKPAGITIEYTRDGGTTWIDYGASDAQKSGLFDPGAVGSFFSLGKADTTNRATAHGTDYQLRVTINTALASIYTELRKIVILCGTAGSYDCRCQISGTLKPSTEYTNITDPISISGWTGYNVIQVNFIAGNSFDGQYNNVRFLFTANGGNTTYIGLQINQILGFGGVGWACPSNKAKTGHLYSYDGAQNATFPATVTATKFIGPLQGNADTATKLGTSNVGDATTPIYLNAGTPTSISHTIEASVPSDAVFTDTNHIAYCDTAASTTAKVAKCDNFTLTNNSYIPILMKNANSKQGKITLNINSTGAKDIYINSAVSSSTNYTLPAGSYIVLYSDSKFYFRTDGVLPGTIDRSAEASYATSAGNSNTANYATSAGSATTATDASNANMANYLVSAMVLDTSNTKAVPNNTNTQCTSFSLSNVMAGRYLIIASVKYPAGSSSSNLWRYTQITTSSTGDSPISTQFVDNISMPGNSQYIAHLVGIIDTSVTTGTLYLKAWHNLGASVNVDYTWQAIRLTHTQS